MRLMLTIFAVVLLIIVDQTQFRGHYTTQTSRLLGYLLSLVGF